MTHSGRQSLSVLRTGLAAVVVADLLSFFFFLGDARAVALANGLALTTFDDLLSRTAVRASVVILGAAAAIAFARKPGRLWEGMLSLGALILLSTAHAQLFGSPWRHLFYSGLCLAGWLLGLAVSRLRGAPDDESYARLGSLALLGAAYFNAGISKLVYGGMDWASGLPIQAVIVGQDGLVADSLLSTYRSWVVMTPAVASLFSAATLGFELAGPLMLVGRRTRFAVALGLFAMHANIYVLTDILYWESMVFLLLFGLSPDTPAAETVLEPPAAGPLRDRWFTASAALLAVGAVLAIGHQGWRFAHVHPAPPAGRQALRQIGPFTVGQVVAEGWTVDSLTASETGFVAALSGKPGRAAFEVTCAASEHRSPFDLGAAHIFYSSDLQVRDFEAAGKAVQEHVRMAAGGDVCESVASWRASAQAGRQ